jgi:hypothetical protein
MRRLAAGAVIVGALVPAGAGAASACDGSHHSDHGVAGVSYTLKQDRHGHRYGVLNVAVSYLGLSKDTIKADLKSGQSLADIANATSGKSADGLVAAYAAALKTKLDAWVAKGKISSTQESDILAKAQPKIVAFVNAHWAHH